MDIKKRCEWCGNEYHTGSGKAKYCSDKCRKEAHRQKQREWHRQNPDYLKRWHQKNPEYAKEWAKAHPHYGRDRSRKIRGTVEYKRECLVCGKAFVSPFSYALTCSKECSRFFKRNARTGRMKALKKNGELDASITLDALIKRDNEVCHICGERINREDYEYKKGYICVGASYPTIDHVVPIAKGGTHTWENVKLAHMLCNARKGAS